MKNLYALDSNSSLIYIDDVNKEDKEIFKCCNCGGELIARKGEINANHFAHKNQLFCSYESYLHKLGKLKFFEEYSNCLKSNQPFNLQYKIRRTCVSCKDLNEIINLECELENQFQVYDLTRRFDKIYLEKSHNGFIADILLESTIDKEVIFIEIAVTHKCETNKLESGIRIVEINLTTEKDIEFIKNKSLKFNQKQLSFHNFKVPHNSKEYFKSQDCKMPFEVFSVLKNGKAIKRDTKMYGIIEDLKHEDFLYYRVLQSFNEDDYFINAGDYTSLIQLASYKGVQVKNCYACRFSTRNTRYDREYSLFCKKWKSEIPNSNHASECPHFWRIEKPN